MSGLTRGTWPDSRIVTASVLGGPARTQAAINAERVTAEALGCKGDGVTDDTAKMQAGLNAIGVGGEVWLTRGKQYLIDSNNLNIPAGVALRSSWRVPGTINSSATTGEPLALAGLAGALVLNAAHTITMQSSASLAGVPVYRKGLVIPAADASAFAGTAITVQGDDAYVGYCLVLGFAQLLTSSGNVREKLEWIYGDNTAGLQILNAYDTPYVTKCHMWPFVTYPPAGGDNTKHHRSGIAYQIDGTALPSLAHLFSYGYNTGFELNGSGGPVMFDLQADGTGLYVGSTGFVIGNGTNSDTFAKLVGCTAFNQTTGYTVNLPVGDHVEAIGSSASGCTTGYNLVQGDLRVIGGGVTGANVALDVLASNSIVSLAGWRVLNNSGSTINNAGGSSTIYVDPSCDFGRETAGNSISNNLQAPIMASADPMQLPPSATDVRVSGTTGFGNLQGGWQGREVTLYFTAALTVFSSTANTNSMRLAGNANQAMVAGSTLKLRHNGVQWFQVGGVA